MRKKIGVKCRQGNIKVTLSRATPWVEFFFFWAFEAPKCSFAPPQSIATLSLSFTLTLPLLPPLYSLPLSTPPYFTFSLPPPLLSSSYLALTHRSSPTRLPCLSTSSFFSLYHETLNSLAPTCTLYNIHSTLNAFIMLKCLELRER